MMKYSVSSYSYARLIQSGKMTPLECIARTKELGFDAIEFVDFIDFLPIPEEDWLKHAQELKTECEKAGLEVSALTVSADFLNKDPQEEIVRLKKFVDVGAELGVKFMRHDATFGYPVDSEKYCSFDSVVGRLAERMREVTEYASSKGIRTMTENHGHFAQDSERVEKLYTAVNHPNFGLLCDMGNFMCADEDPAEALARLAPYAIYVHAKDFILKKFDACDPGEGAFRTRKGDFLRGTIVGHGHVPVKQCLFQLKRCGYDGYVSIEFEGMEDVCEALRIGLANLKKYWAELR